MGIHPCRQAQFRTRRVGEAAAQTEQWPVPRRIAEPHARDRPGARSAPKAQQYGFGLIVKGVAEKDRRAVPGVIQGRITGGSGGGLRPAGVAYVHAQHPCPYTPQVHGLLMRSRGNCL